MNINCPIGFIGHVVARPDRAMSPRPTMDWNGLDAPSAFLINTNQITTLRNIKDWKFTGNYFSYFVLPCSYSIIIVKRREAILSFTLSVFTQLLQEQQRPSIKWNICFFASFGDSSYCLGWAATSGNRLIGTDWVEASLRPTIRRHRATSIYFSLWLNLALSWCLLSSS